MNDESGIKLYPNPARGELNIELPVVAQYEITVSDIAGKQILKKLWNGNATQLQLEVQDGIYFVRIVNTGKGTSWVKKVVVAR